jgi:serine/threonine-protein kinase
MVLEYLVGEDLLQVIRRLGPLAADVAMRITAQACQGVSRAHTAGVIHRDIKPANIFLARGDDGVLTVKVLDFGVAKFKGDNDVGASSAGGLTRTGSMLGSPLYMSPEQARSGKNVDHRSDVWSLGVVLYQAVSGRTPFDDMPGLGELILALCNGPPPPVQGFAPWVAPEVAGIIDRALRLAPDDRFSSVDEMLGALLAQLPGGTAVRDEMLIPLDGATLDHVAPVYTSGGDRQVSAVATSAPGAPEAGPEVWPWPRAIPRTG